MLKSLGLGLSPEDKYRRAFDKGVLLGDWAAAVRLFDDAARESERRGDAAGRTRALANARLYEFLLSGQPALLDPLLALLAQLETIERIGSATETMPAARLATELGARRAEAAIHSLPASAAPEALAAAHERARDRFAALQQEALLTYAYVSGDGLTQTAESRYYLHAAQASWYRAQARLSADPAAAAEEMSRAALAFRQAGHVQGEEEAARSLANLRLSRTCWVCGREMQGLGVNFEYLPSTVRPCHAAVLERSHGDQSTLLLDGSRVAVCVVCKGLIVNQARLIAAQVAAEAIAPLAAEVEQLAKAVQALSRVQPH